MILLDNIIFGMQNKGGVSRFWAGLLDGLLEQTDIAYIEHPESLNNIYRKKLQLTSVYKDLPMPVKLLRYINVGGFYSYKKKCDYNVFHSSYYRISKEKDVKNITTVLDFIFERYVTGTALWVHKNQKRKALYKSDCLVCISESTKRDLLQFYPECANKDIRVIPVGVSEYQDLSNKESFNVNSVKIIPDSYFLYVGLRNAYKGFDRVYNVLNTLPSINLIVVGPPFTVNELAEMNNRGFYNRITNIGVVDDYKLNELYSNAFFFFCPSFYEGFGIPLVEAMKSGCPVIASNRSSIPEVVGDAALLFNPEISGETENAVKAINNDKVRSEMILKGTQQALKFNWTSVVQQYIDIYSEYSV